MAGLDSLIATGAKIGLVGFGGTSASVTVSNLKFFALQNGVYNEVMKQPVLYTMPYPPESLAAYYVPYASFDTVTRNCELSKLMP